MLSLEERLKIREQEQKENEEIKSRVLKDLKKPKTTIDYIKYYYLKFEAETGLYCFATITEKYVYLVLALIVVLFSTYNVINHLSKYM